VRTRKSKATVPPEEASAEVPAEKDVDQPHVGKSCPNVSRPEESKYNEAAHDQITRATKTRQAGVNSALASAPLSVRYSTTFSRNSARKVRSHTLP
jgi:hypothetical protein